MVNFESRKITKSVPESVTCDICGAIHQFTDDEILYCKNIQGFGTLTYVADCGFSQRRFEKHFCSISCLLKLLSSCQYDCSLYFPRPIIEDGVLMYRNIFGD